MVAGREENVTLHYVLDLIISSKSTDIKLVLSSSCGELLVFTGPVIIGGLLQGTIIITLAMSGCYIVHFDVDAHDQCCGFINVRPARGSNHWNVSLRPCPCRNSLSLHLQQGRGPG